MFSTEEILKPYINSSFKINSKQTIQMNKEGEYVKFKNYWKKKKITIYNLYRFWEYFGPRNNEKQNPDKSYTNKYQKHIATIYCYKLLCVDDKFSECFKSYLG